MSNSRTLTQLFKNIQKMDLSNYDEATLKQVIILQIFSMLHWNIFDPSEVHPEYSIGGKRVDYALVIDGRPKAFIEVKKPNENISNHQEQLLNYSFQEGIPLAVLTNGITWWFYLPLQQANWEERKFDSIEIKREDSEDASKRIRDYLSKENIKSNASFKMAEKTFFDIRRRKEIDDVFPRAWDIVVNDRNNNFLDLLNKTIEELSGFRISKENMQNYVRGRISLSRSSSLSLTETKEQPSKIITSEGVNYWMIPVRELDSIKRLVIEESMWAFGSRTPGRKALQRGDWVCFYSSGIGIVAHARVVTTPEYAIHEKVRDPEKYPWIFKLETPVIYLEDPVVLTKELRSQLEDFKNKQASSNWGWFVQSNRKINKQDFLRLTRSSA